jgi:hypothetical protein
MSASVDEAELHARVREVLGNWPVVGLTVGVITNGSLAWFYGHGVADVESGTPIDQGTVFRIESVTKTANARLDPWDRCASVVYGQHRRPQRAVRQPARVRQRDASWSPASERRHHPLARRDVDATRRAVVNGGAHHVAAVHQDCRRRIVALQVFDLGIKAQVGEAVAQEPPSTLSIGAVRHMQELDVQGATDRTVAPSSLWLWRGIRHSASRRSLQRMQ